MSLVCVAGGVDARADAAESGFRHPITGIPSLADGHYPDRIYHWGRKRDLPASSGGDDSLTIHAKAGAFRLRQGTMPHIAGTEAHLILQLNIPLTDALHVQLTGLGVALHDYLSSNAWRATVPKASAAAVLGLPFVHALGEFYPIDKLSAAVLAHDFRPRSVNADGTLSVDVYFQPGVSFSTALMRLNQAGARAARSHYLTGRRMTVTLPADRLPALLALDEVQWVEDREPPKLTTNLDAAALARLPSLWASPYALAGRDVTMGMWDAGGVDAAHLDFGNRIVVVDDVAVSSHATHVAGTLAGAGYGSSAAHGMAPAARLLSYDYYGDVVGEQRAARIDGTMSVSNHSWTYAGGWQYDRYGDGRWVWYGGDGRREEADFGAYTAITANWDRLVYDLDLLVVKSAGNDRNDDGAGNVPHYHIGDDSTLHTDYHAPDGDYDSIGQIAVAKNLITVGAVDDAGGMTAYSGWGPADDGRVKPDIVANGSAVYSTYPHHGYAFLSGTSQAAPVVSGALGLLIERYRQIMGADPGADALKALLIHSARDLGQPGPDFQYGWGLLDAAAAVGVIDGYQGRIYLGDVAAGQRYSYTQTVAVGAEALKVTVAWTDPPASPMVSTALVNDLDLTLIAPDGRVVYPFSLAGLANPQAPATNDGPNRVDNVEQIVVAFPMAGNWTVSVTGYAVQGRQPFALIADAPAGVASPARASLSINGGAAQVYSRDVVVALAGSSEEGVTGYYLAENPSVPDSNDFVAVAMTPDYETQVAFELSGDQGMKTVYGWVRDAQGAISPAAFDTVDLVSQSSGGGGGGVLDVLTVLAMAAARRLRQ